jgi:two-component system cell cycle sensor histidine kinase/response regulator CckA
MSSANSRAATAPVSQSEVNRGDAGSGGRLTVLPPRPIERGGAEERAPVSEPPRGTERILLVDDELPVRMAVRRMLERLGYNVIEAGNGAEALGVQITSMKRIDLVITDVVMPEMDGRVLAECLVEGNPAPRVLFMSGYTEEIVRRGLKYPGLPILQKPFTLEALARAVRESLESSQTLTAA